jgi:hypothetical protein
MVRRILPRGIPSPLTGTADVTDEGTIPPLVFSRAVAVIASAIAI